MTAAAIRATFSEWRMVKGRKVLQLVLELPLEQQPQVAEALGYPMPDREIWVAVARLNEHASSDARSEHSADARLGGPEARQSEPSKSTRAKAAYANATLGEQAVIRAALLAKDEKFRRWVWPIRGEAMPIEDTENAIRDMCRIASRSELATNADAFERFLKMEAQYRLDTGQTPEIRG